MNEYANVWKMGTIPFSDSRNFVLFLAEASSTAIICDAAYVYQVYFSP